MCPNSQSSKLPTNQFTLINNTGQSQVGRALDLVRKKMFTTSSGMRNSTVNVLLMITDGKETPGSFIDEPPSSHIKALQAEGDFF